MELQIDQTNYFQTGDVLYFPITSKNPTKGLKKQKGNLIHKGQDHLHTIEGDFQIFTDEDSKVMVIKVNKPSVLKHQEHADINIPKGVFLKRIVLEQDHFADFAREVID